MEYIVIWIICGDICAVIADSKGRSVGGWLLGGILLGIFGVIILALLQNPPNARLWTTTPGDQLSPG